MKTSFYDLTRTGRTQIEFELIKNVSCRVYFAMDENSKVFSELSERIRQKKHYFSPYLGLVQFTATIEFADVKRAEPLEKQRQPVY